MGGSILLPSWRESGFHSDSATCVKASLPPCDGLQPPDSATCVKASLPPCDGLQPPCSSALRVHRRINAHSPPMVGYLHHPSMVSLLEGTVTSDTSYLLAMLLGEVMTL
ncbi:hypothetical protein GOP47_0026568 [Adiantum capillus-veneris]|nr:hypothetical protein GOP47_0026568 [Adiantum capillus-veneris]